LRTPHESAEGVGYLLKDRISDVKDFAGAVRRVAEGRSAIDPTIASQLLRRHRADDPLEGITPREHEVLALMAEGRSNQAIADRLASPSAPCKSTSPASSDARAHGERRRSPPRARRARFPALVSPTRPASGRTADGEPGRTPRHMQAPEGCQNSDSGSKRSGSVVTSRQIRDDSPPLHARSWLGLLLRLLG
jgi:Bacterial regulatory proteins, luxR family